MQVARKNIIIPPNQVRLNPGNLQELADNIKQYGLLHPIVVTEEGTKDEVQGTETKSQIPNPNFQIKPESTIITNITSADENPQSEIHNPQSIIPSSFRYTLVAGYRRLKAVELLGWTEVPVTIISPPNSFKLLTEFDLHLSENIQRKELSPLELSDAIFERKARFEQVYGPIKNGGDRRSDQAKEISFANCETDPPNFYEQTARLCRISVATIYRILQLQGIDADLKVKVYARELSYATALSQQAERNQAKKKQPISKGMVRKFNLPNRESAELLTSMFRKTPKLFQLFQLVNHTWQTFNRLINYQEESNQLDLEILHHFITQLGEVLALYQSLFTHLQQTQDQKLNAGKDGSL
jgi:hypothetical protein